MNEGNQSNTINIIISSLPNQENEKLKAQKLLTTERRQFRCKKIGTVVGGEKSKEICQGSSLGKSDLGLNYIHNK